MEMIRIAGNTDTGQSRKDNQDAFICKPLWSEADALLAVIDGVGGYAGGDVAAALAKESITRYMATPKGDTLTMLREAVVFANNKIAEERKKDPRFSQMCCVLTAAVADTGTNKLFFVHVGDTRLYRFRNGDLEKLTKDHSMVGIREDAGELTEKEAMTHPRRNEILREAGSVFHRIDDPDFLDHEETDFRPGDLLLICSDGLSDMLTREQMISVLSKDIPLEEQVNELIALANRQGGHDNITLVLAKNLSAAAKEPGSLTRKNTTGQRPALPEPTHKPGSILPQQSHPGSFFRKFRWMVLAVVAIVLAIGAGAVWKWWKQPEGADLQPGSNPEVPAQAGSPMPSEPSAPSSLAGIEKGPGNRWQLKVDTIRLTDPFILEDSLIVTGAGDGSVIVPADTSKNSLAFRVKKNSMIRMENVEVSGFKTGISAEENVRLRLKNVRFEKVDVPVSTGLQQNSYTNEEIIFSSTPMDSTINQ